MINAQNPFAFQGKKAKKKSSREASVLSSNIKGICPYCRTFFQKIKKFNENGEKILSYCHNCSKKHIQSLIVELPEELIPWKIAPSNRVYDDFLAFQCSKCHLTFNNFRLFGSLCSHKKHVYPVGSFCRLCCRHESPKEEEQTKEKEQILYRAVIDRFPQPGHLYLNDFHFVLDPNNIQ